MVANTYPTTATFGSLVVAINTAADGAAAAWKAPCGFDSKSLTLSAATSEANVPPLQQPRRPGLDGPRRQREVAPGSGQRR